MTKEGIIRDVLRKPDITFELAIGKLFDLYECSKIFAIYRESKRRMEQQLTEEIKKELHFMMFNKNDKCSFLSIVGYRLLGDYLGDIE